MLLKQSINGVISGHPQQKWPLPIRVKFEQLGKNMQQWFIYWVHTVYSSNYVFLQDTGKAILIGAKNWSLWDTRNVQCFCHCK